MTSLLKVVSGETVRWRHFAITKLSDGQQLQEDLNILNLWETDCDMDFNSGKCQVLHITKSRCPIQTSYIMHGQILEMVSCAKYLGVDMLNDLSRKAHVFRFTGNSLGFLRRNLKSANLILREKAYKVIVRSQLEYAIPVWDPHTQNDISKIEMVQRWVARWALFKLVRHAREALLANPWAHWCTTGLVL